MDMGKRALVTGGSGGIGSEICRALAGDGWEVFVGYHSSRENAEKVAAETGGTAVYADVSKPRDVEEMFEKTGGVDLLVNNAGVAHYGLITDLSFDDWRELFGVNADGAFLCCRAAVPYMVRQKSGCIINVSSMWGQVGASCESAYSASKSATVGLTKALAKELAPSGIRVNCIAPGVVLTPMLSVFSDDELEDLRRQTPLSFLGEPKDVAALAVYLASDRARYMTGQIIGINGGFVIV
ncbi:MAG: 3-oxoacyl-ACP reductase FabG [Oscillospiraceae bacterium]|jgi:3-oxoacyl-[acyl-carrier protein] reductase|nr:3-oxoacyl-ACP reductase FabG [Oscillospiraceae bacterium]